MTNDPAVPAPGDPSPIGPVRAVEALSHFTGNSATGGVWRVRGETGSAVLKHLTPNDTAPTDWNHWKREAAVFREGFGSVYCADTGLAAPEALDVIDHGDGSVALWLEDVHGVPGERWDVGQLGDFARRLGVAQAQRLDNPPAWLSRRFLRRYATRADLPTVDWEHPAIVEHWPPRLREALRGLWECRFELFFRAERLPSTVCHLDVWPKNLFARGEEFILIDWAFVGHGAIGEDVGNLIPDTVLDGLMDVALLDEIRERVTDSYIDGYRDAGGEHSGDLVRHAVAVTGAAKYAWLAPMMVSRLSTGGSPGSANYDPGSAPDEVLRRRRPVLELLTTWASAALDR